MTSSARPEWATVAEWIDTNGDSSMIITEPPLITDAELDDIEAAEDRIGGVCGAVRPGTLGYQRCWRIAEHDGAHLAQDRGAWVERCTCADMLRVGEQPKPCPLHGWVVEPGTTDSETGER